jgi:hypothetical protein
MQTQRQRQRQAHDGAHQPRTYGRTSGSTPTDMAEKCACVSAMVCRSPHATSANRCVVRAGCSVAVEPDLDSAGARAGGGGGVSAGVAVVAAAAPAVDCVAEAVLPPTGTLHITSHVVTSRCSAVSVKPMHNSTCHPSIQRSATRDIQMKPAHSRMNTTCAARSISGAATTADSTRRHTLVCWPTESSARAA